MWVERCPACTYEGGGTVSLCGGLPDDSDVAGFFQLSDLVQFSGLRELLPELQSQPSPQIIQRLRANSLRWHVSSLKKWKARRYQSEAAHHGFEFIIVG
jgi:hypothetical protein